MTIREFQQQVADVLNAVEALVQGGCKAFAENSLTVMNDVQTQLQQAAGVALVVTTPDLNRNGCAEGCIPCDTQMLIRCMELPAVNRERQGALTAMDAGEIVNKTLDGTTYNFITMRQTVDNRTGVLTVTCTFNTEINL